MTAHKNAFLRAFDAVVEARMRRAEHEVAMYRGMYEVSSDRKIR